MDTTKNRKDEGTDHARVVFHPPLLLLSFIGLGFAARWFVRAAYLPSRAASTAGPVLFAAAFVLFVWAVTAMRRGGASIPTGEPTDQLIFTGPYRFSRNPIYLSMVALVGALAVWANSLWFVGLAFIMVVLLNWGVISREEQYLEQKFGEAYERYRSTVRRWC